MKEAKLFDYIIIGSGFGGSVSAWRLVQKGYKVLVMERGKRHQAKDFAEKSWQLPTLFWFPTFRWFGIFSVKMFRNLMVFSGSGVGGGSLVYANTLIQPGKTFFEAEEWKDLADWEAELLPHYDVARKMLGVSLNPKLWPADEALKEIASELGRDESFDRTPVGVFFGEAGKEVADPYFGGEGPNRTGCIHCGECISGCRYGAKNSLDKNYLYLAEKKGGVIWPESEVLAISPMEQDGGYQIRYRSMTKKWKGVRTVSADKVIVAAGVMGTINLLLQCQEQGDLPNISSLLGKKVRSNSEALLAVTERGRSKNPRFDDGVAITSHFWVDDVTSIEPVRYPLPLSIFRWLSMPLIDDRGSLGRRLMRLLREIVTHPLDFLYTKFGRNWAKNTTILLVMQTVENQMQLERARNIWTFFQRGLVSEVDPENPIPAVIEAGRSVAQRFAQKINGIPQGTVNEVLFKMPTTAHILGGCVIGKDESDGVIDINHELFHYPGIYVVDGSVVPANLGVNPSLTITALAERAMARIPAKGEEAAL